MGSGAALAGMVAVALGPASQAEAAASTQSGWLYCTHCQGFWWHGNGKSGVCYGNDYQGHATSPSSAYYVKFATAGGGGQSGWYYCAQCQLMHYGSGSVGNCPVGVGTRHTSYGSSNYRIETSTSNDGSGGQHNWRYCSQCRGIWWDGNGRSGACPGYPGGHIAGSTDYILRS